MSKLLITFDDHKVKQYFILECEDDALIEEKALSFLSLPEINKLFISYEYVTHCEIKKYEAKNEAEFFDELYNIISQITETMDNGGSYVDDYVFVGIKDELSGIHCSSYLGLTDDSRVAYVNKELNTNYKTTSEMISFFINKCVDTFKKYPLELEVMTAYLPEDK